MVWRSCGGNNKPIKRRRLEALEEGNTEKRKLKNVKEVLVIWIN
jgi:hypothetical protein